MKLTALTMAATILATRGFAAYQSGETTETVRVCVKRDARADAASSAMVMANRILVQAGVKLEWQFDRCGDANGQTIIIDLSGDTNPEMRPGSLAYALPYEGVHIHVFYDRIAKSADPAMRSVLLAYVFVHEITHILQGIERHSDHGIMKARWDSSDRSAMLRGGLAFDSQDVEMIRAGVRARAQRQILVKLYARNFVRKGTDAE